METVIDNVSSMQNNINNILPSKTIIMWSGLSIPDGFALCDGNNDTPNLKSRFIVCYSDIENDYKQIGNKGGAKQVTLTMNQMPSHKHADSSTDDSGIHTHNTPNGKTELGGSHRHDIKTTNVTSYADYVGGTTVRNSQSIVINGKRTWLPNPPSWNPAIGYDNGSYQVHNLYPKNWRDNDNKRRIPKLELTGQTPQNHNHPITTTSVEHTHTLNINDTGGIDGVTQAHENRPPYYTLAYIMKL